MNYKQRARLVGTLFYTGGITMWVLMIVEEGWLFALAVFGGTMVVFAAIVGVMYWVVQGDKVKESKK